MFQHKTIYRVIYGDTDTMGMAYYANYLRWFEMGRTEFFRALGLSYKAVEKKGYYLPVSEVHCKYISPARYDDLIVIQAALDGRVKAGVKFLYQIYTQDEKKPLAQGFTKHACLNRDNRVVRPPDFLKAIISDAL